MNVFHRKQLRMLLGIRYPEKISNDDLYERCTSISISEQATTSRWKLLGHVLRMKPNVPAHQAMTYYFEPCSEKGFQGMPKMTLPTTINTDLNNIHSEMAKLIDSNYIAASRKDPAHIIVLSYVRLNLPQHLQCQEDLEML